ncbi:virulence-associated E family protein [Agathobaculum sp. NTUH-O15-33]|uniref:virulence-associated E family protein n=1 Tax=Agathobaculum sp. NTUH-O15-33 TaxID=3079302 RepID=UPI0029587078|nr:virulence-associated E family protein [Agathobaculum sp. NTUH-O15-33]WNX84381.1 virulence-associated E family protein [Agathobaculum sp. NTUH-O15-33]
MINDRKITISTAGSRRATNWQPQTLRLSELYERLRVPARSTETMAAYLALSKGQQDDLKDVGGFVAGTLNGPRRKAGAVSGRDVLTLDLDSIPAGGTDDVARRVEALGCGYCIYSTRKHMPSAPRLRVLLPLDRTCTADEYEPCARRMAEMIGMELCDPTTFEASRLMYFPSCCADGEYIYYAADKPMLSADGLLATYADWHDTTSWPTVPGAPSPARLAAKQGDPLAKHGAVGAFCRVYDIEGAMAAFLPGVYESADIPGRFTFTGGSTTGGAVLYDDGKFLYSHHATDPCGGRLVNAFDLVRLHRFDDQDDTAAPGTPVNRLPSYTAMCELATQDPQVSGLLLRERWEQATEGFTTVEEQPEDTGWMQSLKVHAKTGVPLSTIDNVWLILEHDPRLKGKFALNAFAGRGEVLDSLPWSKDTGRRLWDDNDNAGLYWYMEKYYQITGTKKIDDALSLHSRRHAFNDVVSYLNVLSWDGVERLDTLFIDYLGAEDTPYTRAVTRKAFTAAVARAMHPGIKFDSMTILSGPQGLGKSTLLDKMSRGWFNDSIRTFEGKEASELLQGVWIVEVAELDAFRRTDVSRIKQFMSQRVDRFRAAYGRHVKDMPRCCVFFGTTNTGDYLQDKTGNRRFLPIDVGKQVAKKNVWRDLDQELDQLWAEAVMRWRLGEPLYLVGDLADAAKAQQEDHREVSAREGLITEFLERQVPQDWQSWSMDRRRMFWGGNAAGEQVMVPRDRICALEIWCELLDGQKKDMRYSDTQEINAIIAALPEWEKAKSSIRFGYCGKQKGWVKARNL